LYQIWRPIKEKLLAANSLYQKKNYLQELETIHDKISRIIKEDFPSDEDQAFVLSYLNQKDQADLRLIAIEEYKKNLETADQKDLSSLQETFERIYNNINPDKPKPKSWLAKLFKNG